MEIAGFSYLVYVGLPKPFNPNSERFHMKENTVGRNNRNDVALENNFMFTTVMKNKKACIKLLEAIFGDEHRIADIRYARHPEAEMGILSDPMRRGVRLDVYFDDGRTIYDIELQRTSITDLAERTRMYSSSMDVAMLDKGEGFGRMRTSYVIFLCTFDPFERDEKVYRFATMCENVQGLPLGDRRYIMFLNSKGSKGESSLDMDELFRYLNGGVDAIGMESKSELVKVLDGYVQRYNRNDDWRKEYMKLEFLLKDKYDEGEAKGVSIGEAKGISIGEANAVNRMAKNLKEQGVPIEVIAKAANLSIEEVNRIQ